MQGIHKGATATHGESGYGPKALFALDAVFPFDKGHEARLNVQKAFTLLDAALPILIVYPIVENIGKGGGEIEIHAAGAAAAVARRLEGGRGVADAVVLLVAGPQSFEYLDSFGNRGFKDFDFFKTPRQSPVFFKMIFILFVGCGPDAPQFSG